MVVVVAGRAVVLVPAVVRVVVDCSVVDVGVVAVVVDVASGFARRYDQHQSEHPESRHDLPEVKTFTSLWRIVRDLCARLLPCPCCPAPTIGQSSSRDRDLRGSIALEFPGRIGHFRLVRSVLQRVQAEESGRWHQQLSAGSAKNKSGGIRQIRFEV